ncbi:unnamed protein product [Cylindrotheca closterium]|uniref:subtilisin n=1 Tax=Cylindrotheca closterium TaxID=2856 RepID=A0AAD2FVR6_9STRA|nr:unnamed protein product [Cylindrotheca closterium]
MMMSRYTSRRRRSIIRLLLFLGAFCLQHQAAYAEGGTGEEETIKVLVGFKHMREEVKYIEEEDQKVRVAGNSTIKKSKIKYQFKNTNAVAMEVTRAEYEEMQKDSRFSYIEEDFEVKLASFDPPINEEEQLLRRTQQVIREVQSYAIPMTQSDQFIPTPPGDAANCMVYTCIVDSGVYINHQDIPYDRGDGYTTGRSFGSAVNNLWYRPVNTNHGTNVAGIMFATPNNNAGMVGAIPNPPRTSRICLKVAKVFPDGSDSTSISTVVEAVEWCASEANGRPMIINLSLATPTQTSTERRIYERIYNDNVLLVAAAGNGGDSELAYPASHDSVISVASVNSSRRKSSFSQFNDKVELSAPGSGVHVTDASETGISVSSGTSYACPYVAAIAARIWAVNPRCSNRDIRDALQASTRPLGNFVPNDEYGYGLVQAKAAYDYLVNQIGCGVPTGQPSPSPTKIPSASPSQRPSHVPSQSPSNMPSSVPSIVPSQIPSTVPSIEPSQIPSAVPSLSPTEAPTIDCLGQLEECTAQSDCCKGFSCLRISDNSYACRKETEELFNTKPRLAALDGGTCRGGFAGNCPIS